MAEAKRAGAMGVVSADMVVVEGAVLEVDFRLLLFMDSGIRKLVRLGGVVRKNAG